MAFFSFFKSKMFLREETKCYNNAGGEDPCYGWIKIHVLNHNFQEYIIQNKVYTHDQ